MSSSNPANGPATPGQPEPHGNYPGGVAPGTPTLAVVNGAPPPPVRPLAAPVFSAMGLIRVLRHRWQMAVGLGLAAAGIVAAITYMAFPKPKNLYTATSLVLLGQGKLGNFYDYQTFQRTQLDVCKTRAVLDAALLDPRAAELATVKANRENVARWLDRELKVDLGNSDRPTQIMRMSLTTDKPDDAVILVNSVKDAYIKEVATTTRAERESRAAFLETGYKDLHKQLLDAREDLQKANNDGSATIAEKLRQAQLLLGEHQKELSRLDREQLQRRIRLIASQSKPTPPPSIERPAPRPEVVEAALDSEMAKDSLTTTYQKRLTVIEVNMQQIISIAKNPESLPEFLDYKKERETMLAAIEKRRKDLRPLIEERLRPAPPAVSPLPSLVNTPEEDLKFVDTELREWTIKVDRQTAMVNDLEAQRQRAENGRGQMIETRRKDADRLEKLEISQLEQLEQARLALKEPPRVTSVQDAREAELVASKDPYREMKMAGVFGAAAFVLVVFVMGFREFRSRRVHSTQEVAEDLGMTMLGSLPKVPETLARFPASPAPAAVVGAVDALRTMLLYEASARAARVFMVTSAVGQEGKSVLASQLAISLARAGKRTLLVDGDLVHPSLGHAFEQPPSAGLRDVLAGKVRPEEAIRPTRIVGLSLLQAGPADAVTSQALASGAAAPLFEALKADYDVVIVDSAPILRAASSLQLAKHVDAVLFAVLREVSRVPTLHAAHQRLAAIGVRVLGAVLLGARDGIDGEAYSSEEPLQMAA